MWRADADEAAVVAGLLVEFRDWWGRATPPAETFAEGVGRLILERDTEYLLGSAAPGNEPAAVCQLRFRFSVWHAAEDCWLEDVFVREGVRRSGLGSALVEAVVQRARERACARIELDVNEGNRVALAFYEALGFSAAPEPGTGRTLLMRLRL